MVTLKEYLNNPCGTLSIPYWKNRNIIIPDNMFIIHENSFSDSYLNEFNDEKYFRLIHNLKNIDGFVPDGIHIKTASKDDLETIVEIINRSYTYLQVDMMQMKDYTNAPTYNPELWVIAYNDKNLPIGCGIADFDNEAKEGILEWIQVLPEFRRCHIGSAIVNELLLRLSKYADFATVSGKMSDEDKVEDLYKKCGFKGNDIWHIMTRKRQKHP